MNEPDQLDKLRLGLFTCLGLFTGAFIHGITHGRSTQDACCFAIVLTVMVIWVFLFLGVIINFFKNKPKPPTE